MVRGVVRTAVAVGLSAAFVATGVVSASGRSTVVMSGNAYAFIFAGNNDRLEGAVIGIEEFPDISTTAGPNGAYSLEVPNNATITPFIEFPGYYPTHIQTFHTAGQDLRQVNFQVPEMSIAKALAGITNAKMDPQTGLLEKCAIVSTFFELAGRNFSDFNEFHEFHPHGVPGSTVVQSPASGRQYYFNKDVIPDPAQKSSSRDGGVLWADVDEGVYQLKGHNPDARFASVQATCEPGRLVNANPPWGLYQLSQNEVTNPAALPDVRVDARLKKARVKRVDRGPKRVVKIRIAAKEHITATISVTQGSRGKEWTREVPVGKKDREFALGRGYQRGKLVLQTTLRDDSGNISRRRSSWPFRVPPPADRRGCRADRAGAAAPSAED